MVGNYFKCFLINRVVMFDFLNIWPPALSWYTQIVKLKIWIRPWLVSLSLPALLRWSCLPLQLYTQRRVQLPLSMRCASIHWDLIDNLHKHFTIFHDLLYCDSIFLDLQSGNIFDCFCSLYSIHVKHCYNLQCFTCIWYVR